MKKIKKVSLIMCALFLAFSTTGCNYKFKGEHPELFTVAINSILGARGSSPGEWVAFPSYLEPWEEDEYGRRTFVYCERDVYFLLVSQATCEKYVYFYPDYNFIHIDVSDSYDVPLFGYVSIDEPEKLFSDESIEWLKEKNSWNMPIDESKCAKVEISRKKNEPKIWTKKKNKEKAFETLCQKIAKENECKGEDNVFRYSIYCTSDNYGRALYYVYGVHRDIKGEGISPKSQFMEFDIAMIFNPDGTYSDDSVMQMEGLYNQDDLKAFKELNNWNQPF